MAVAQGTCPNCGAPIEFAVGSSLLKVCEYCRHSVVRSDRGLENLGKVADLADTPSLIAVGDEGTLLGRPFKVMGRVQLDHGSGPWDEYYVAFDYGQRWGWLAYAQGHWYATELLAGQSAPAYAALRPELDLTLAGGFFRVAEVKSATIRSIEGELPGGIGPGQVRYYADCIGPGNGFATLDYAGDRECDAFVGFIFGEPQMQVTALGPRSTHKLKTTSIRCPNCGGAVPKLSGDRAERLGCPYCGAVSEIATQSVVAVQEAARKAPDIPLGQQGSFDGVSYVCIAYLRRGTSFEGEPYAWEEYLLWSQPVGYRWLVKDPETGWTWVVPVNLAELDLRQIGDRVTWHSRSFRLRNRSGAIVEYVLGEVYWKCEVGETASVMDFIHKGDVLSREEGAGEVNWSFSTRVAWPVLAQAFGLPVAGAGAHLGGGSGGGGGGAADDDDGEPFSMSRPSLAVAILVLMVIIAFATATQTCGGSPGGVGFWGGFSSGWSSGSSSTGSSARGSGVFHGGK